MTTPKTLSLVGRGLKLDTRADVEPHLTGVDPTTLEEIHLCGNTIGVDASLALADFLKQTQVLRVADFADIFTGRLISEIPIALSAICDALKDKSSLVEIDLSDNAFGGRSVEPIVPLLIENRSFQILRLNNNGLGPAGGIVLADALHESAKKIKAEGKKSNLKVVVCGRNRLEDPGAEAWAKAFAEHGTLVEVRMIQNGIRMKGIEALAAGLAQCPDLEHLELQDNTFTVDEQLDGVKAWTESLYSWSKLHTLNLSDCVLSVDGEVPTLIEALAKGANPKLRYLQLQNNNLYATTFAVLAGAISQGLLNLTRLELQWNEAEEDDEHLANIALALKQRGGKLYFRDEDEDEEEEEEEEKEEEEAKEAEEEEEKKEEEIEIEIEIDEQVQAPKAVEGKKVKDPADELADLLGKVSIKD